MLWDLLEAFAKGPACGVFEFFGIGVMKVATLGFARHVTGDREKHWLWFEEGRLCFGPGMAQLAGALFFGVVVLMLVLFFWKD